MNPLGVSWGHVQSELILLCQWEIWMLERVVGGSSEEVPLFNDHFKESGKTVEKTTCHLNISWWCETRISLGSHGAEVSILGCSFGFEGPILRQGWYWLLAALRFNRLPVSGLFAPAQFARCSWNLSYFDPCSELWIQVPSVLEMPSLSERYPRDEMLRYTQSKTHGSSRSAQTFAMKHELPQSWA